MAIEKQKKVVSKEEAEFRFKDLCLVPYAHLKNIDDVTPQWLKNYEDGAQREIENINKCFDSREAKRFEIQIKDRLDYVKNLCKTIFASRNN